MLGKSLKVIFTASTLLSAMLILPVSDFAMSDFDNFSFESQLVDAADKNNASIVKLLLQQGANPNERGRFETTALHRAAYNGFDTIANLLIASGADLNSKDFGGATPLHMAARQGNNVLVSKLLQSGAEVDTQDNEGYTAFHRAVSAGNYEIAKILLSAGASPNVKTVNGDTPVMEAVRSGNSKVAELLASSGANNPEMTSIAKPPIDSYKSENFDVSSTQNVSVPVAKVEQSDELIPYNDMSGAETSSIEIPAVVLPNSERAKMIAQDQTTSEQPKNVDGYQELVPYDSTRAQAPRPTPETGFENLYTDTIESKEEIKESEFLVSSAKKAVNSEEFAGLNTSANTVETSYSKPKFLEEESQVSNPEPVKEIEISSQEIRDNMDFSDSSSGAGFASIKKDVDPNLPLSFSYRTDSSYDNTIYSSPEPKFNYQKYQSEELYTTPVQSLQVVNLATKEVTRKNTEPFLTSSAVNYSTPQNMSLPASMTEEYYESASKARSFVQTQISTQKIDTRTEPAPRYDDNYAPASMSSNYRNRRSTPQKIWHKQDAAENMLATPTQQPVEKMQAVPVASVEVESLNDNYSANRVVPQPASIQNNQYQAPEQNNMNSGELVNSIQNFYNENRTYPSYQPLENNNIKGQYRPASYHTNTTGAVAPSVSGNITGGPRSMQFWNNVPESKRAALYNRITQHNAPVYTEPKRQAVAIAPKAPEKSEDVLVSIEPVSEETTATDLGIIESPEIAQNTKVPEVAVQEETIESLVTKEPETTSLQPAENLASVPSQPEPAQPEQKENVAAVPTPASTTPGLATLEEATKIETSPDSTESQPQIHAPEVTVPELPELASPQTEESAPAPAAEAATPSDVIDYSAASEDVDLTGTHAVIGAFDTQEKATEYFNGISLRLGLLYSYKMVQSNESNKYYIAVGKLENADSANKVCEVYASEETPCEVYLNLSYGSKKLTDFSLIESKKVYAVIGEFGSAEQADAFFKQYSAKYKVAYKIAQDPENNIYLLQIGPVFNGGDGKRICDEMKAPNIKCRVALK